MCQPSLFNRHKKFPEHWKIISFNEAFLDKTGGQVKIQKSDYLNEGDFPIVDQGQEFFGGFTNSSDSICKIQLPCILFGDHTKLFKFIDKPFVLGADGIKVLEHREDIDPKFAFHYLCTLTLPNVGYSRHFRFLKRTFFPLPPIAEQKRIAAILDQADGIRRKQQEAIRLTEELLRSTFLEMFGDPENTPYPVKTLAESCELITDGTHKTPTYVNEGVPFLRVTDIQDESINWNKVKYIPMEEHLELIKRCHPIRGDILYSKNGTIGIPKIIDWDVEFNIFVSLALLRPKPHVILGEYLESFLHTPFALRQALSHTKTGTVSNLHLVEIRKVKLPVPAIEVQEKWLFQRSQIQKQQKKQLQTFIKTDNLFKSLLQRAFKGEL